MMPGKGNGTWHQLMPGLGGFYCSTSASTLSPAARYRVPKYGPDILQGRGLGVGEVP